MKRRSFLLETGGLVACGSPLEAAVKMGELEAAAGILEKAAAGGQVRAASLYVSQGDTEFGRAFGEAASVDGVFLLASISKTISAAAVMTLFDRKEFALEDRVTRFLPEFKGEGRETITMRQLLTHVSGLPDQVPENAGLRAAHAPLSAFVEAALRTPLLFEPGARYHYSSMAILLATEVARRISGRPFADLVDEVIYGPLGMKDSAMGVGRLDPASLILNQVEFGAPESGAGDPSTKSWDWNSAYWRHLGAPWGGAHGSAPDVARFLGEFLRAEGKALRPETARLMIRNHNGEGIRPRGLGFDLGPELGGTGCGADTFGHTGSTGTRCWADPDSGTICVILTTLPAGAVNPHPRDLASERVAGAVN